LAEHVLSKPDVLAHLGARGVEAGSRAAPVQSMGFANEVQSAKGDPMPVNPGGVGPGSAPASEAARGGEDAPGPDSAPRVFLSHSSHDKAFVRRLTNDLNALNLNLWLDERELRPGDSIVGGIDKGLREADYLVVVLSQASVASKWVTAEMNAVLMRQFSDKGVTVVPVLIEDCPIPLMIRDRVYADFRTNYQAGFTRLRRVFEQESRLTRTAQVHRAAGAGDDLAVRLGEMSAADLRRLLGKAMSRPLVATLWYDTFGSRMDDDMANRSKEECVIELLLRADERKRMPALIGHIVKECPSLLDP